MNKRVKTTLALLVLGLVLGGTFYLLWGLIQPQSLISISRVYIDPRYPGGESPSGEWTGSFWILTASVDVSEDFSFITLGFDDELTDEYGEDTINGNKLIPQAEINVEIHPGRPYYLRKLVKKSVVVTPKTYYWWKDFLGSWHKEAHISVPETIATIFEYSTDYWEIHTPFTVTVTKTKTDPDLPGEPFTKTVTIDPMGYNDTVIIENPLDPSEKLKIKNLGALGGQYQIDLPPILGFTPYIPENVFEKTYQLESAIPYDNGVYQGNEHKYSWYWFRPCPAMLTGGLCDDPPRDYSGDKSPRPYGTTGDIPPGWDYNSQGFFEKHYMPIKPDVYNDKPFEGHPGRSLINYLKDEGYAKTVDIDVWNQGVSINDIDENSAELKVWLPPKSISSLITITISTELADSIVWHPHIGEAKIVGKNWVSSGNDNCVDIKDEDTAIIKVKNVADFTATFDMTTYIPPGVNAYVNPSGSSATIGAGETENFVFDVVNQGVSIEQESYVKFELYDGWSSTPDDTAQLCFKLKPTITEQTLVTVYVLDSETHDKVSGIIVKIDYGGQSELGETVNGQVIFDITPYTGAVKVETKMTDEYKSGVEYTTVQKGHNSITIFIEKIENPFDWLLAFILTNWVYITIIILIIIFIGVLIKTRK